MNFHEKIWITRQLIDNFLKLHGLRAFHGDFGTGKVLLTSQNQVLLADFAPIKPFCLQYRTQIPLEFYQIWFDEGLDGDPGEIGKGCYLAPERLSHNSVESYGSADLFSLGCVLAELFSSSGESFLQFKHVLRLNQAQSPNDYSEMLDQLLLDRGVEPAFMPLIRTLCSQNPSERVLSLSDLAMADELITPNIHEWREFFRNYRDSNEFYRRKELIHDRHLGSSLHPMKMDELERLLMLILRESDAILRVLLVELLFIQDLSELPHSTVIEPLLDVLGSLKLCDHIVEKGVVSLDKSSSGPFKFLQILRDFFSNVSGSREILFQQVLPKEKDLHKVLNIFDLLHITDKQKSAELFDKLVQIYRSRGIVKKDFEARLLFNYYELELKDQAALENAFKSFSLDSSYLLTEPLTDSNKRECKPQRIGFQLDLKKNKIPIQSSTSSLDLELKMDASSMAQSSKTPKLRQRLLTSPIEFDITESIIGTVQSPDRMFFLFFSQSTLFFWDMKAFMGRLVPTGPLASINPRANSVISCVIFGMDSKTLYISFSDGIIGIYKYQIKTLKFFYINIFNF